MWNPGLYNKFKAERFASFNDLLRLVTKRPKMRVLDLGCGTGELTRRLADSLPEADVLGVDSSPEMLLESRAFATEQLRFELASIEEVVSRDVRWDLVFSHTALHWVADHRTLFPRLVDTVALGGQLVVEFVHGDDYIPKVDLDAVAGREPFRGALGGWRLALPVLSSEEYATILFDKGGKDIVAFEKVDHGVRRDVDAIYDFAAGTFMSPYMKRLPPELHPSFREEYRKMLRGKYPRCPVFFATKKVFMAATF